MKALRGGCTVFSSFEIHLAVKLPLVILRGANVNNSHPFSSLPDFVAVIFFPFGTSVLFVFLLYRYHLLIHSPSFLSTDCYSLWGIVKALMSLINALKCTYSVVYFHSQ